MRTDILILILGMMLVTYTNPLKKRLIVLVSLHVAPSRPLPNPLIPHQSFHNLGRELKSDNPIIIRAKIVLSIFAI